MSKGLDPYQDPHSVDPDLGPNCFQRLLALLTKIELIIWLEKVKILISWLQSVKGFGSRSLDLTVCKGHKQTTIVVTAGEGVN